MRKHFFTALALILCSLSPKYGWTDSNEGLTDNDASYFGASFESTEDSEDTSETFFSTSFEKAGLNVGADYSGYSDCGQDNDCGGKDCSCGCCLRTIPYMMGDSMDAPIVFGFLAPGGDQIGVPRHYIKVADNNGVLPETRIGVGFNQYVNVPKTWSDTGVVRTETDISEYKLYLERAIYDGDFSFNLILPVYDTIDFTQTAFTGLTILGAEGTQFGNLAFGFKKLLRRTQTQAVSAGLQVEAPTAEDYSLFGLTIPNDQWFFTPYLGKQWTPNDRWYAQGFLSYRLHTGDNSGGGLSYVQAERLLIDGALGYWMFRNDYGRRFVTGLSPRVELHYTTYTENQDPLLFTSLYFNRIDMLNLTLGATAELANGATLASGLVLPMRQNTFPGGDLSTDTLMDWELILQYNLRF